MISRVIDFEYIWSQEIEATQKVFKHLTDKSLTLQLTPEGRTLGRLAWHITLTIPEMMSKTGLHIIGPDEHAPIPASAKEILRTYSDSAVSLLDQVKAHWTDDTLQEKDDMYGEKWKRGFTLMSLVHHQIHHRGQMTVLMRQAGLNVPGIYGPARHEWAAWGMQPPIV